MKDVREGTLQTYFNQVKYVTFSAFLMWHLNNAWF